MRPKTAIGSILCALCVFAVLMLLSSCSSEAATAPMTVVAEGGVCKYTVVRGDVSSAAETAAAVKLRRSIEEATGAEVKITTDWEKEGIQQRTDYEILVGRTNREESISAEAEVGDRDFIIRVDGTRIVLLGSDDTYTGYAVDYFIENFIGYADDGKTLGTVETLQLPSEETFNFSYNIMFGNYLNVADFGAKGDGVTDDSGAVQLALDAAYDTGAGSVYFPSGIYRLCAGLSVRMGTRIFGDAPSVNGKWAEPSDLGTGYITAFDEPGAEWLDASLYSGTWILVDHDAGNVNGSPTFRLEGNTSVDGFGFVYAGMAPVSEQVTEYPPAVAVVTTTSTPYVRDGVSIDNIKLLNAYIGIALVGGNGVIGDAQYAESAPGAALGRMRIHNVSGCALYRGIYVKAALDTVDIRGVRFGYTFMDQTFAILRSNNCIDFEFVRADGLIITDVFSYGAKVGVQSTASFSGGGVSLRMSGAALADAIPLNLTASGQYEVSSSALTMVNFSGLNLERVFLRHRGGRRPRFASPALLRVQRPNGHRRCHVGLGDGYFHLP